jgi:predicted ATP-binding protein involved in virulence
MNQPFLTQLQTIAAVAISVAAGFALHWLREVVRRWRLQRELERVQNRSIKNPNYGKPGIDISKDSAPRAPDQTHPSGVIFLESVTIKNFKNITEINLDLMRPSSLTGEWTCIAGINGAGKTSILQAICLVLLGGELVNELGRGRLGRLPRRTTSGTIDAEIEAVVLQDGKRTRLYLPLKHDGRGEAAVDTDTLRSRPDYPEMAQLWSALRRQVVVGYGASRNVSDFKDSRLMNYSQTVQRQMTLFDPLTQLASVDVILEGGKKARPVIKTLYRLILTVLQSEALQPQSSSSGDKLRFSVHDATLDVIDLPDGFRSSVAWLADLCAAWHECGSEDGDSDPAAITGIVLLDEIGLHLHPSLEKALVPQLRKALPRVQFIVSTHSPMVLSGFDRDELVVLDVNSPGGTRQLDRQVFGMTMDDVYSWLMNTSPGSPVMEEMLQKEDPDVAMFLYQSKDVNEDLARKLIEERHEDIKKLQRARDDV